MADNDRRTALAGLRKYAATVAGRDDTVRAALAAGIPVREIQRESGIARTTIMRIRDGIEKGQDNG